jgi:hypothetical protein
MLPVFQYNIASALFRDGKPRSACQNLVICGDYRVLESDPSHFRLPFPGSQALGHLIHQHIVLPDLSYPGKKILLCRRDFSSNLVGSGFKYADVYFSSLGDFFPSLQLFNQISLLAHLRSTISDHQLCLLKIGLEHLYFVFFGHSGLFYLHASLTFSILCGCSQSSLEGPN